MRSCGMPVWLNCCTVYLIQFDLHSTIRYLSWSWSWICLIVSQYDSIRFDYRTSMRHYTITIWHNSVATAYYYRTSMRHYNYKEYETSQSLQLITGPRCATKIITIWDESSVAIASWGLRAQTRLLPSLNHIIYATLGYDFLVYWTQPLQDYDNSWFSSRTKEVAAAYSDFIIFSPKL